MRTDENNNPAAFTTDIARQAGLILGTDYETGTPFGSYYTAKLLGDPIAITIQVIDKIGYYTATGALRWTYIAIPKFIWLSLTYDEKKAVIAFHYSREGGTAMKGLFV